MYRQLLARFRISYQIAVLAMIGICGVALVTSVSWRGITQLRASHDVVSAARDAAALQADVQIALLQARRSEKDFLLRRDEGSITRHTEAIKQADDDLIALRGKVGGTPQLGQLVQSAAADVHRYAEGFAALVRAYQLVGLDENHGLQGELRDSVHSVEDTLATIQLPAAQISMLMMRRHEKDFIARLDPKYGVSVRGELPKFRAALDGADLPDALKADLTAKIEAYQATFGHFLLGMIDTQTGQKALSAIYTDIEPRLDAMTKAFRQQAVTAEAEGNTATAAAITLLLETIAGIAVVMAGFSWFVGAGISRPIIAVTRMMQALSHGNLDTDIPQETRGDEIGTMMATLQSFKESLVAAAHQREAQAQARVTAEADKRAALSEMANRVEAEGTAAVGTFSKTTTAMKAIVGEMRDLAGRTGLSARQAAGAATTALENAQSVASASEQLSASIHEISGQVSLSTGVVAKAVAAGQDAGRTIEALNERVNQIGAVVKMISGIAAQTNLLALNATIEAARAGEAGKGFAVVASEVKQLANQTARSTQEIVTQIASVRAATEEAVAAVAQISTTIGSVNEISASIAAAVEQQGAATAEIARNINQTAIAVHEVTNLNAEVSTQAERAEHYAGQVLDTADSLDVAIVALRQAVVRTVRTATPEANRRADDRIDTELAGQVSTNGAPPQPVRVLDLSPGGVRVAPASNLSTGSGGSLRIAGLDKPLAFTVKGREGDMARLSFTADDLMRPDVLAMIQQLAARHAA